MAGEGVDVLEAYGGVVRDQRPPVLRRGRRHRRDAELEVRPGVVVHHQEDVLAGEHGVVEGVLQALAALGEDLPAGRRGASASQKRYSEVIFDPDAITRKRSLRVRPTPTQKRPSVSWCTSSSSLWLVPSRCRQILSARQASSTVV